MAPRRRKIELPNWAIPVSYAVVAIVVALALPRFESRWLPAIDSGASAVAAVVIYSSIASGMMALTGVVFSLAFVMVQFSAIAYRRGWFTGSSGIECCGTPSASSRPRSSMLLGRSRGSTATTLAIPRFLVDGS